jgi:hypothetical protein
VSWAATARRSRGRSTSPSNEVNFSANAFPVQGSMLVGTRGFDEPTTTSCRASHFAACHLLS